MEIHCKMCMERERERGGREGEREGTCCVIFNLKPEEVCASKRAEGMFPLMAQELVK